MVTSFGEDNEKIADEEGRKEGEEKGRRQDHIHLLHNILF